MSKARIIEIEEQPKLKPSKLEITIESEEDLVNLWLRMDLNNRDIENSYPSGINLLITPKIKWKQSRIGADAWQILEDKAKELGLRE